MKEFSFFVLGAVIGGLWVKRSMDNAAQTITLDAPTQLTSADGFRSLIVSSSAAGPVRLGDVATDENHYSKRAILAGILTGAFRPAFALVHAPVEANFLRALVRFASVLFNQRAGDADPVVVDVGRVSESSSGAPFIG